MAKAIIIYGSTTGNTEMLAGFVADGLEEAGIDVRVKNVIDASPHDILNYDIAILGASTWNDGELQEDFINFYNNTNGLSLDGKKAAVFGPGDSSHEHFCAAVDILEDRLKECGAEIIADSLKIDGDVEDAELQAQEWGKHLANVKHI